MDLHTEAELELDTEGGPPVACRFEVSTLRETRQRIELGFDRARLHFSLFDTAGRLWLTTGDGGREIELAPGDARGHARTPAQTLHAHWTVFLRGLSERRANHTSARSALLTTAIVEQCYAAAGLRGEPGAP